MQTTKVNTYNEDSKMRTTFTEQIQLNMEELDFFLLYLKERKEDQFEEYVQALEKNLKGCII